VPVNSDADLVAGGCVPFDLAKDDSDCGQFQVPASRR
jgi:hypothetical protein